MLTKSVFTSQLAKAALATVTPFQLQRSAALRTCASNIASPCTNEPGPGVDPLARYRFVLASGSSCHSAFTQLVDDPGETSTLFSRVLTTLRLSPVLLEAIEFVVRAGPG